MLRDICAPSISTPNMSSKSASLDRILRSTEVEEDLSNGQVGESGDGYQRAPESGFHGQRTSLDESNTEIPRMNQMLVPSDIGTKEHVSFDHRPHEPKYHMRHTAGFQGFESQSRHSFDAHLPNINYPLYQDICPNLYMTHKIPTQHYPQMPGAGHFQGPQIVKTAKRMQVKNACTNCQKACKKCDDSRPCARCIKYNIADTCVNSTRKERAKGLKRGPYKRRDEGFHDMTSTISLQKKPAPEYHSSYIPMHQPVQPKFPASDVVTATTPHQLSLPLQAINPKLPSLSELQLSMQRQAPVEHPPVQNQFSHRSMGYVPDTRYHAGAVPGDYYQGTPHYGPQGGNIPLFAIDLQRSHPVAQSVSESQTPHRITSNKGLIDVHLDYLASKTLPRAPVASPFPGFQFGMIRPSTPEYYRLGSDMGSSGMPPGSIVGNYSRTSIPSAPRPFVPEKEQSQDPTQLLPSLKLESPKSGREAMRQIEGKPVISGRLDELSDLCSVIGPNG